MKNFTPAMMAACKAALDAKIFYQEEFKKTVIEHMGGYDCHPVFLRKLQLPTAQISFKEKRSLVEAFEKEISSQPRGTYGVIADTRQDGRIYYRAVMADGTGENATGCAFDIYETEPSGEHILSRIIGYEIYSCRKHVEALRIAEADRQAVSTHNLALYMVLREFKIPGEKPYSNAVITGMSDSGTITLFLTKKGSRKRWTMSLGAARVIEYAGLCNQEQKSTAEAGYIWEKLFERSEQCAKPQ